MPAALLRFLRNLLAAVGNDDARELAGGPDVDGGAEVDGLVERATLDAERLFVTRDLVPDPTAAIRAEDADDGAATVGGARPALNATPGRAKVGAPYDDGDPEGGGRLLLALAAVADEEGQRLTTDFLSHAAALAAAGSRSLFCSVGHRRSPYWRLAQALPPSIAAVTAMLTPPRRTQA